MTPYVLWTLAIVGALGGCYAGCLWLVSRFGVAVDVYRRKR